MDKNRYNLLKFGYLIFFFICMIFIGTQKNNVRTLKSDPMISKFIELDIENAKILSSSNITTDMDMQNNMSSTQYKIETSYTEKKDLVFIANKILKIKQSLLNRGEKLGTTLIDFVEEDGTYIDSINYIPKIEVNDESSTNKDVDETEGSNTNNEDIEKEKEKE